MQKQPSKELVVSEDNKVTEQRAPSLTNDEVEEFRAYFNEKMSILQKDGKRSEGTGYRPDSGISDTLWVRPLWTVVCDYSSLWISQMS